MIEHNTVPVPPAAKRRFGTRHGVGLVLLVTLTLVTAWFALASHASAAGDTAWNGRTLSLRFPAQSGDSACAHRDISLAAGKYFWHIEYRFLDNSEPSESTGSEITLPRSGTYTWVDCLDYSGFNGQYRQRSYLIRSGFEEIVDSNASQSFGHAATPGVSTWFGSSLTPQ